MMKSHGVLETAKGEHEFILPSQAGGLLWSRIKIIMKSIRGIKKKEEREGAVELNTNIVTNFLRNS